MMAPRPGAVVTIVGGGWSAKNCDLERLAGTVIAVNDAALYLSRWDIAVSMDRLWTENRWDWLAQQCGNNNGRRVWLRESAVQNITWEHPPAWLRVFCCDHLTNGFSSAENTLNGTNSGACALNLAWRMKPARLYLLGFDMNRSPNGHAYWYPHYPWSSRMGGTSSKKYDSWAGQFHVAALDFRSIGCEVSNVSPRSAIAVFRKITPAQYLTEANR